MAAHRPLMPTGSSRSHDRNRSGVDQWPRCSGGHQKRDHQKEGGKVAKHEAYRLGDHERTPDVH